MADLPRRDFTPLAPPPHGSADARRRGRLRRRRQQTTAGAATLAVVASVLGATVISTSTSAIDRLEPAPFATGPGATDDPPAQVSPSRGASQAPAAPAAERSDGPAAEPSPEPDAQPSAPAAQTPATADPAPPAARDSLRLVRTYDPPTGNDTTVCTGRISSGIGAPSAQTGWCVTAAVTPQSSSTDFSVRVCRSSEGDTADLHVDEGAVLMRVEQDGAVVWRLPSVREPAAVLRTEPSGCWVWTWTWDGRSDSDEAVPPGPAVLHVAALADEVRDLDDQEQFTHQG